MAAFFSASSFALASSFAFNSAGSEERIQVANYEYDFFCMKKKRKMKAGIDHISLPTLPFAIGFHFFFPSFKKQLDIVFKLVYALAHHVVQLLELLHG